MTINARTAPLRKVVKTYRDDKGSKWDDLECGHRFLWFDGDKYGFMGTWPAKRRRCTGCQEKEQKLEDAT